MRSCFPLLLLLTVWPLSAAALSKEDAPGVINSTISGTTTSDTITLDMSNRTLADYIEDYVDLPAGATDWKLLGKTKEKTIAGKTPEGYDFEYHQPEFPPELKELDGKEITLKGFMFPLDEAEEQKLFLLGPFPIGCPFQYHVTSSLVVEVQADDAPVAFSYDPVTIKGRLQLVEDDPENSTFYRLLDARQIF